MFPTAGSRLCYPRQFVGEVSAKATMYFSQPFRGGGTRSKTAAIDPALHFDVCQSFELQVSFFEVRAVIVFESALDVDGWCVVPLDKIAVVAVHRPHEVGEPCPYARRQTAAESRRSRGDIEREIDQGRPLLRL